MEGIVTPWMYNIRASYSDTETKVMQIFTNPKRMQWECQRKQVDKESLLFDRLRNS